MVDFLRQYRKNVIAVIVLAILLVVLFLVQMVFKKEDPNKALQNQDYVYTFESNERKQVSHLPQINLKGDMVKKENAEIMRLYYTTISSDKNQFTYKYVKKDNLLFLLIEIYYYETLNAGMETRYISYINDIETGELVTNEEVLKKYGYTENMIGTSITNKMKAYYEEASMKGLIVPQECDFACYMGWRDMENIKEGASLYIEDNKLVVYRGFTKESVYADSILYDKKDAFLFSLEG